MFGPRGQDLSSAVPGGTEGCPVPQAGVTVAQTTGDSGRCLFPKSHSAGAMCRVCPLSSPAPDLGIRCRHCCCSQEGFGGWFPSQQNRLPMKPGADGALQMPGLHGCEGTVPCCYSPSGKAMPARFVSMEQRECASLFHLCLLRVATFEIKWHRLLVVPVCISMFGNAACLVNLPVARQQGEKPLSSAGAISCH